MSRVIADNICFNIKYPFYYKATSEVDSWRHFNPTQTLLYHEPKKDKPFLTKEVIIILPLTRERDSFDKITFKGSYIELLRRIYEFYQEEKDILYYLEKGVKLSLFDRKGFTKNNEFMRLNVFNDIGGTCYSYHLYFAGLRYIGDSSYIMLTHTSEFYNKNCGFLEEKFNPSNRKELL